MADPGGPDAKIARWERVQLLFHAAAELPEAERGDFLRAECGGDHGLLEQTLALLAADAEGSGFLDAGIAAAAEKVLQHPEVAWPLREFGPYRITGVLGEGGMGVVYRAHRADLSSDVAVKVLRDALLSPSRRERFTFEQRALAQLNHPAIARLYDAGAMSDGAPWFAMELVEGVPITDYCRAHGLSIEARLRLFREVCGAVEHAHAHALLHRDLKPSNLLVRADGQVRLLDFGIAKSLETLVDSDELTRTGLRLMTPAYAAPEQVRGGPLGVRTDIYSLGVILYELLAGRLPFDLEGLTPSEAATVLTEQEPKRPSTVARDPLAGASRAAWNDLDVLCLTAMHRDESRRYRTVDALIRDLDRFLSDEPLEARADSFRYRAGKFLHRHRAAVFAGVAAFVVLVTMVAFYTARLTASRNEARAEAQRARRIETFMTGLFAGGDPAAGPSDTLRVITLVDRGARDAKNLSAEPEVQADLEATLGGIYQAWGRLDQADSMLSMSWEHRQSSAHATPGDRARSLMALALLRSAQERHDEAESLAGRALALAKGGEPPGGPLVAEATATLGQVLENRGSYFAADSVLTEAVRLMSSSGNATAERIEAETELANTRYYLGRLAEADSINRRVALLTPLVYGPRHPNVANDLINLGSYQQQIGHYPQAESLFRQALEISRGWYGDDHQLTAACLTDLARALVYQQRFDEAAKLLEQALAVQQRIVGPRSPEVAGTLSSMADIALYRDRYEEALALFGRAAEIYREAYGSHHPRLAITLSNLGSTEMQRKRDREAERWFRESIEAYAGAVPANNLDVGITRIKLGRALLHQRRYAEAERETLAGYRIVSAQADPGISFLVAARKDLVADYEELGRPADADRFRKELANLSARR